MSTDQVQDVEGVPFREGLFVQATSGEGAGPRLIGSKCGTCGTLAFPRRITCRSCDAVGEQEEVLLAPRGTLYTYAVVRHAPKQFPTPYVIGYVDLDDGVRVFTQVDVEDPDELKLGQRMELTISPFGESEDGRPRTAYRFRPSNDEE